ncbi:MAG: lipoate--protein ligase family protein [Candidatus Bipolaricaulia bacterium]
MRLIVNLSPSEPAAGLALDEALFESVQRDGEEVLRLWINDRSVIVGRSQKLATEVDLPQARSKRIPVLRRISGGGAVYHYRGNLNVSVMVRAEEAGSVANAFARFGGSLRDGLAAFSQRIDLCGNSLMLRGEKIAGAAQARRGRSVLYHSTILVCPADLPFECLLLAHRPDYASDGVPSRPEAMTTLSEAVGRPVSGYDAADAVVAGFASLFEVTSGAVSDEEAARSVSLAESKYRSDAWNASR